MRQIIRSIGTLGVYLKYTLIWFPMASWITLRTMHPLCAVANTKEYLKYSLAATLLRREHCELVQNAYAHRTGLEDMLDKYAEIVDGDTVEFFKCVSSCTESGDIIDRCKYITHLDNYSDLIQKFRRRIGCI